MKCSKVVEVTTNLHNHSSQQENSFIHCEKFPSNSFNPFLKIKSQFIGVEGSSGNVYALKSYSYMSKVINILA